MVIYRGQVAKGWKEGEMRTAGSRDEGEITLLHMSLCRMLTFRPIEVFHISPEYQNRSHSGVEETQNGIQAPLIGSVVLQRYRLVILKVLCVYIKI